MLAVAGGVVLAGCAAQQGSRLSWPPFLGGREWLATEEDFIRKPLPTYSGRVGPDGLPTDTVVGARRTYRVRKRDTLLDVARYYDIGYDEILRANPGMDPWLPPVDATVIVPSEWVLPCCTYDGIVLNIPEMRLFYYRREKDTLLVSTYP